MAHLNKSTFWIVAGVLLMIGRLNWAYDADVIDVHLVCHSHTDAGWYMTYDSYYKIIEFCTKKIEKNKNQEPACPFEWRLGVGDCQLVCEITNKLETE